ncbi:MAG TPA: S4 domain-containing protein [Candidatus Eisenbacteria bacterium]
MRFDVALFELRLFKSRSAASAAIQDGQALLNGAVVKPSHGVKPGDRITLEAPAGRRTLEVVELPRAGLSKEASRALLREVATEGG